MITGPLAGRSMALLASALSTIALLTTTLGPVAEGRLATTSVAATSQLAMPDDENLCRFPQNGNGETFPCLPKPPRPAPEAHS